MANWWTEKSRPGHWFPPSNLQVLIFMVVAMGAMLIWQYVYWKDRPDKNEPIPSSLIAPDQLPPALRDPNPAK